MLILIEGLDFSGKTTVLTLATQELRARGFPVMALEGGPLTGGWYRTLILQATEKHAFVRPVQVALSMTMPLIDRLCFRRSNYIVLHTSYLDRALAYEIAEQSIWKRLWLHLMQNIGVVHDLRILLVADLSTRIERYERTCMPNYYDDRRFFSESGLRHFCRMDIALRELAQRRSYIVIDTTYHTVEKTIADVVEYIEAALVPKGHFGISRTSFTELGSQ